MTAAFNIDEALADLDKVMKDPKLPKEALSTVRLVRAIFKDYNTWLTAEKERSDKDYEKIINAVTHALSYLALDALAACGALRQPVTAVIGVKIICQMFEDSLSQRITAFLERKMK